MIISDEDIKFTIYLKGSSTDMCYVVVHVTEASSKERAKQAAAELSSLFTEGRETFWRAEPEGEEQKDFESGGAMRRGYARFSFRLVPGGQHRPESYPEDGIRYSDFAEGAPLEQQGFGT